MQRETLPLDGLRAKLGGTAEIDYARGYVGDVTGEYNGVETGQNLKDDRSADQLIAEAVEKAKDADYLIYNSTIDGGVKSVDELIEKCSVLSDFKAVKSGDVWCTEKDVYQQSMSIGFLIEDIHNMLQGADDKEMNYLYRLD